MPAPVTRAQKDRGEVSHTTKKPWRQKGTGRARAGMSSSPLWRGGGRIFPNRPDENFSHKVNRKMYRAGLAAILSQLAVKIAWPWLRDFSSIAEDQAAGPENQGMGLESSSGDYRQPGREPSICLRAICPMCWCLRARRPTRSRWFVSRTCCSPRGGGQDGGDAGMKTATRNV
jgi:hypothetical protein